LTLSKPRSLLAMSSLTTIVVEDEEVPHGRTSYRHGVGHDASQGSGPRDSRRGPTLDVRRNFPAMLIIFHEPAVLGPRFTRPKKN
jgi:hypothetical protein